MFVPEKMKVLESLVAGAGREELIWLNGYVAGLLARENTPAESAPSKPSVNKITITYGTETGNSKKLASEFAARAKKKGIIPKLVSLDQYRVNDLQKEEYFLTIVSTQGEGDPPAAAKKFYDHIHNNGFKLEQLKFGVLALGDTSYPLFCKAGEDVDQQLGKLGGKRLVPLQKCDTDYESAAQAWFDGVLQELGGATAAKPATAPQQVKQTGKKFYNGTILNSINLNDRGSNKETYHIEIGAEDLEYLPGDSLGIIPENPEATVQQIIALLQMDPARKFSFKGADYSAYELLKKKLNITYLPERVVAKYAQLVEQDIPSTKIGLLDLLKIYPLKSNEQFAQLVDILEPLSPRLYSISSSPEAHPGEIHITVARDKFCQNEEWKNGLCSDYLACLPVNTQLDFYIHKNAQFRLPEDDKDIIMIGPGTGIAPFRSFIAHRDATGASGRNWLFFGEQHFVTDFLYQTEIQSWMESGVLSKVDVAFSRDTKEKVYVQHKMVRKGAELYQWMQDGALIYVCGSREPMSVDVENTLVQIARVHGNKSETEAIELIESLKDQGRYLKDVY